jgi:hypothetical protein
MKYSRHRRLIRWRAEDKIKTIVTMDGFIFTISWCTMDIISRIFLAWFWCLAQWCQDKRSLLPSSNFLITLCSQLKLSHPDHVLVKNSASSEANFERALQAVAWARQTASRLQKAAHWSSFPFVVFNTVEWWFCLSNFLDGNSKVTWPILYRNNSCINGYVEYRFVTFCRQRQHFVMWPD